MKRGYSFSSRAWLVACLLSTCVVAPLRAQTSGGQIADAKGQVEVKRRGQTLKASLLMPLRAGDTIAVRQNASAEVVLFPTGARFTLSAGSLARLDAVGLTRVSGQAPAAKGGVRIANFSQRKVTERTLGALTRGARDAGPNDPSPNGVLREGPVVLKWEGTIDPGVAELQVRIHSDKQTVFRSRVPRTTRELAVPAEVLRPGEVYRWEVIASESARASGLVGVLTAGERKLIEQLEQDAKANPGDVGAQVLLAQIYERLGMLPDAKTAYEAVLKLRPEDAGVKQKIAALSK